MLSAISDLIPYLIFVFLGLAAIFFLVSTFKANRSAKPWTLICSAFFCFLIFKFNSWLKERYEKGQLDHVGIYYLTDYPNCDHCILELKEDKTYQVSNNDTVLEKSNWHFESGGDYWITYLDNDRSQLGGGQYAYKRYRLKYARQRD